MDGYSWTKIGLVVLEPKSASMLYHGLRFGYGFRFHKLPSGVMKIRILEPLGFREARLLDISSMLSRASQHHIPQA